MLYALRGCVITLALCDLENYHLSKKWIKLCAFFLREEDYQEHWVILIHNVVINNVQFKLRNSYSFCYQVVYISSLRFIPGFQVDRYLGIINLFLIRESTSIREASVSVM